MKKSLSLMLSTTLLTSCAVKVGPHNLKTDTMLYNKSLQNTNDSQLLLNLVRMRYRDTPTFLQVGVISAAYEFRKSISGELRSADNILRGGLDLTEKPTITLSPTRGEGYVKEFMGPIAFESLLLINTSWPIDRILRCCVQRLNDLKNAPSASGPTPSYPPEFREFKELVEIFRELEKHDGIDIVVVANPNTERNDIAFELDPKVATPEQLNRIWELLGVDPGTYYMKFVPYHGKERGRDEVMVQTRSPISVLYFLSQGVHVPIQDEYNGLVTTTLDEWGNGFNWDEVLDGVINIQSSCCSTLENSCLDRKIKVYYRGTEFYIDDRDLNSKATFSMVSQLLALQTGCVAIPALTIPLNN